MSYLYTLSLYSHILFIHPSDYNMFTWTGEGLASWLFSPAGTVLVTGPFSVASSGPFDAYYVR